MQITILGHYTTQFGELWNSSFSDLLKESIFGAITDAGLDETAIEAIFVANMGAGQMDNQLHVGALASQMITGYPAGVRVEAACASGGVALTMAEQALLAGRYSTVLVVGIEKMNDVDSGLSTKYLSAAAHYEKEYGSTFPGLYALLAQAHMSQFGTTRDQLSAVAVKNHEHGFANPQAQYHKHFTIDQVNKSMLVADPLRLLDCSPITDGASAVVLSTKKKKGNPTIIGFGHGQDSLDLASRQSLVSLQATQKAAKQAYQMAGVTAQKVEVAEVHDCFTIAEILASEDLGFFEKGTGGSAVEKGQTTYKGKVVINPSGGLKASGHPVGATGVKQVAYLAGVLERGEFKLGLTHNVGGSGATAVVHVIQK